MSIYDYVEKNIQKENLDKYNSYINIARKYSASGFDEGMIIELLQIDGCPVEISHKVASSVIQDIPNNFDEGPPVSYLDVKEYIEKSISKNSIEDFEKYFKQYANKHNKILESIVAAKINKTNFILNELHRELEPVVENIIIANRISVNSGNIQKMSSKEENEKNLFGVWPIEYVHQFNVKNDAEKNILQRSSKKSTRPSIII